MLVHLEIVTVHQAPLGRDFEVGRPVKVDALQRRFDVEFPAFALGVHAVPIEDPIGGVGGLLDLGDQQAGADGVEGSGGQEIALSGFDADIDEQIRHGSLREGGFQVFAGDACRQSPIDGATGFRAYDVPTFGLGISAAHAPAGIRIGMHLHAQNILGIQQLDEDGEGAGKTWPARDALAVAVDHLSDSMTGQCTVRDDRLVLGEIDQFPTLSDAGLRWQGFGKPRR